MRTACVSPVAGSTGDAVYLLPAPKVAVQTGAPSRGRQGQSHHVGVTQFQQRSRQRQCHRHRAAARYERHHSLQQLQEPAWHVAPQGERRRPDWSLQHQLWQLRVQGLPGERCVARRRYCVPLNWIRRDVGERGGTVVAYLHFAHSVCSVNVWCYQSAQSIRVLQCYRTRHLFLHCTVPCASTHKAPTSASSPPAPAVTPLSHLIICVAVQRLREHSACVNDAGN